MKGCKQLHALNFERGISSHFNSKFIIHHLSSYQIPNGYDEIRSGGIMNNIISGVEFQSPMDTMR